MSSFFAWMGGKSKVAGRLSELLPAHKCYIEVFSGAANLLFVKDKSKTEVINDINSDLINLFRIVRYHSREFINELKFSLHNRQDFNDYRQQPGLTDIQRAARTFFIIRTAFGGLGGTNHPAFGYGTTGKTPFKRQVFSAVRRCHKRLNDVYIENLDFADCIKRYDRPHAVFYCDPPYLKTSRYQEKFSLSDHYRLAEILKSIRGKFLLTINDHKTIRELYKKFYYLRIDVKYSVSLDKTPKARNRSELVIANYPLPKR